MKLFAFGTGATKCLPGAKRAHQSLNQTAVNEILGRLMCVC